MNPNSLFFPAFLATLAAAVPGLLTTGAVSLLVPPVRAFSARQQFRASAPPGEDARLAFAYEGLKGLLPPGVRFQGVLSDPHVFYLVIEGDDPVSLPGEMEKAVLTNDFLDQCNAITRQRVLTKPDPLPFRTGVCPEGRPSLVISGESHARRLWASALAGLSAWTICAACLLPVFLRRWRPCPLPVSLVENLPPSPRPKGPLDGLQDFPPSPPAPLPVDASGSEE